LKIPNLVAQKIIQNTINDLTESMPKFLTFFFTILLLMTVVTGQIKAQVVTEIGDFQMCNNTSVSMPVMVQNLNGIDKFHLVLEFDQSAIEYVEYFAVTSALSGGTFNVSNENDSLIISWARTSSVTISQDTLVWLTFKGLTGSTSFHWNTASSYYQTSGVNTLAIFGDGNAVVAPKMSVSLSVFNSTCASSCDANYEATASGGMAPYTYLWDGKPGRFNSIQTGLCAGERLISVIDQWGCRLDSTYTIEGLPGANVDLIIEGNEDTTIYLQNPVLSFRFEENYPTHVIEPPLWFFGDGDSAVSFNPTHVYSRAISNTDGYYNLKLIIKNDNGCDSTIEVKILIKEAKLKIPGVMTPNGDSFNESFMILNENKVGSGEEIKVTTEFQHMELVVFDRWGRKIYNNSNYQNDWHAEGVPDGAYYFKLTTVGYYKTDTYKGSITILGSGNSN